MIWPRRILRNVILWKPEFGRRQNVLSGNYQNAELLGVWEKVPEPARKYLRSWKARADRRDVFFQLDLPGSLEAEEQEYKWEANWISCGDNGAVDTQLGCEIIGLGSILDLTMTLF